MRACLDCARLTAKTRCPECARKRRKRRKAEGLTGERGSTAASRKRRANVLARDGHRCRYCGAPATVADHVKALALGGADTEENLVASCKPCNAVKADKPLDVFRESDWLCRRRAEVATPGGAVAGA